MNKTKKTPKNQQQKKEQTKMGISENSKGQLGHCKPVLLNNPPEE